MWPHSSMLSGSHQSSDEDKESRRPCWRRLQRLRCAPGGWCTNGPIGSLSASLYDEHISTWWPEHMLIDQSMGKDPAAC